MRTSGRAGNSAVVLTPPGAKAGAEGPGEFDAQVPAGYRFEGAGKGGE